MKEIYIELESVENQLICFDPVRVATSPVRIASLVEFYNWINLPAPITIKSLPYSSLNILVAIFPVQCVAPHF